MVLDMDHHDCEMCKKLKTELTGGRRTFVVV